MSITSRSFVSLTRAFATTCSSHHESIPSSVLPEKKHDNTYNPDIDLPPDLDWNTEFPFRHAILRDRVSVRNPTTASLIAESFVPKSSHPKIILEAFPGPGALTRALLKLPHSRVKKIIVLEDHDRYLEYLRPLEKADPRIHVVPIPGFSWDAYVTIQDMGLLDDVKTIPWTAGVHPQLHFISHLPRTVLGEQLVAQLFRGIPEKSWLFKYGRVPMSFVLSDWVWQRISAARDDRTRCKLSVIAEAVADVKQTLPPHALQPYDDHFHPAYHKVSEQKEDTRRSLQTINIIPLEEQVIDQGMLEKWDYCLRHLFVLKSTSLKSAIGHLAPGAQVLLKEIRSIDIPESERVDIRKQVRKLTIAEWATLVKAFDRWPFAPEDLSISDSFGTDQRV